MPEEPTGAGAPHDQPTEGQQPTGAGAPEPPTQPDREEPPAERQPSANKRIKDFAAERGISVEELLTNYQHLEDAGKTELERLTGQVNDFKSKYEQATTELRNVRSESAFLEAAREARARAPRTLFRAFRDQLDYDAEGNPTNIADVIAAAKAEEPDLFVVATGTSDAGRKGDGSGEARDINALIRQMATEAR